MRPSYCYPIFFGASLVGLDKPDGGIRPIAVGCTLRRLAAKCLGSLVFAQGGYNGPCVVGDFKRQTTGILNISHLRHSLDATSRSALSAKFPRSAISLRKMASWIISRF